MAGEYFSRAVIMVKYSIDKLTYSNEATLVTRRLGSWNGALEIR
jgi:hypothetical protein